MNILGNSWSVCSSVRQKNSNIIIYSADNNKPNILSSCILGEMSVSLTAKCSTMFNRWLLTLSLFTVRCWVVTVKKLKQL